MASYRFWAEVWFFSSSQEAKKKGLRLVFKHIPIDIFDKRAVQKGEVIFHDVAYIEFKSFFKVRLLIIFPGLILMASYAFNSNFLPSG